MDLIQSKVFAVVTLGIGTIIVGILPACFTNQGRNQWPVFLSCLLCFGGGVLLSTSLLHILPELREALPPEYRQHAELFFCAGFFILYMMDEIVHFFYGEAHDTEIMNHHHNKHSTHSNRRHSTSSKYTYRATKAGTNSNKSETDPLLNGRKQAPYNPSFYRARSDSVLFFDEAPSQLCHVGHQEPCLSTGPTVNVGLLVALSIHALLEGLVVGLEGLPSKVLLLLGAIASHKLVVGFCLGVELASNALTTFCRQFLCILIFTLGSVGGILIGMVISNVPNTLNNLVIPILQGLAGGTLLYVTVSEVLPRERARWHQEHEKKSAGIFQFVSVVIGFGVMTALSKYLDH